MRKGIRVLFWVIGFLFIFSRGAFGAEGTTVDLGEPLNLKAGEKFSIPVYVKNISRLYAGSIDITYDKTLVSLKIISPGSIITGSGFDKFQIGGTPDQRENKISYDFTFTGKVDGFTGDGEIFILTGQAVENTELNIKENTRIKLMSRTQDDKIQEINFNYYVKPQEASVSVSAPSAVNDNNYSGKYSVSGETKNEAKYSDDISKKNIVKSDNSSKSSDKEVQAVSGKVDSESTPGSSNVKLGIGLAVVTVIGLLILYIKRLKINNV